jgi:REP element-mobilizing transposase RayT
MSELPDRHRPAHYTPVELGNRAILIFLTVCTKERMPCLASDDIHQILRESWTAATGWRTGRYVVLPDHVHLFCAPACWPPPPMHSWVRYWKRLATVQIRKIHDEFQWQRDIGIPNCVKGRAILRNGPTLKETQFGMALWIPPINGPIKVRFIVLSGMMFD